MALLSPWSLVLVLVWHLEQKRRTTKTLRASAPSSGFKKHCRVPEGSDVGKPVVLREWQKQILIDIYDNPEGTRRAIISFARKNGKTALVAFILLLHLIGPRSKQNSHIYSAAQSRDQAAIIFGLAAKVVRLNPALAEHIIMRDSRKELVCPPRGTRLKSLPASVFLPLSSCMTSWDKSAVESSLGTGKQ